MLTGTVSGEGTAGGDSGSQQNSVVGVAKRMTFLCSLWLNFLRYSVLQWIDQLGTVPVSLWGNRNPFILKGLVREQTIYQTGWK